ncbi:MAG: AMP-binding protein [Qipengyuania pacifica]
MAMTLYDIQPQDIVLGTLLERRATEAPNETFFTWNDESHTLREFNEAVNEMARNLLAQGISKGAVVAIIMETSVEYLRLWFALAKIGAVEVPINNAYRGDLLAHALRTCGASVCMMDGKFTETLAGVVEQAPDLKTVFVLNGKWPESPGSVAARDFAELTAPNDTSNIGDPPHFSEVGGVIFTSGTTGPSKGVLLSHYYLAAYGFMYREINALGPDDVVLNFLPFFHIGAKFLTIATLASGGRMHLQERLSITTFWETVRRYSVTNFIGVGGICNMLLSSPPSPNDRETPIKTIYAVPDPADVHREIEERFNCKLTTVFGSTEVGLPLFRSTDDDYQPESCGRVSPYYEVRIVDQDDQPLGAGEVGEIVVRPKLPFLTGSGYVNMPEKTVESWRNLWLHSGDNGYYDANGWFYFVDRATDSIRRRGENISSYEVEQMVGKHPAVAEVAAMSTPSEVGEDEVWVQIIAREKQALTPEEVLHHCADVMPYFMIPRFIEIVADFPRTPTAKVEKFKLRSAGPGDGAWDCTVNGWKVTRDGLKRVRGDRDQQDILEGSPAS